MLSTSSGKSTDISPPVSSGNKTPQPSTKREKAKPRIEGHLVKVTAPSTNVPAELLQALSDEAALPSPQPMSPAKPSASAVQCIPLAYHNSGSTAIQRKESPDRQDQG